MLNLKTLAGVENLKNEATRNELMNFPSHFRETLGVDYRGSKKFVEACEKGETYKVLKWLFDLDRSSVDEGMYAAAKYGNEEAVRLCKEFGATDFAWAMWYAAEYGHENMVLQSDNTTTTTMLPFYFASDLP